MADKYLYLNPTTGVHTQRELSTSSAGAGDAGRGIATGADGLLDASFLPVGVGASFDTVQASENLSAGDLVNYWVSSGNMRCRKADASSLKPADGFVQVAVTSGNNAQVYRTGRDTAVTGLTIGEQFLSATTPGTATATAPSTAGQIVQRVGFATAATSLSFTRGAPTQL